MQTQPDKEAYWS